MEPISPIELLASIGTDGIRVRVAKHVDAPKARAGVILELQAGDGGCLVKHDDGATYGWSWSELVRESDPEAKAVMPEDSGQIWIYKKVPISIPASSTFNMNISFGATKKQPEPPSYMDQLSKAQSEPEPEPVPEPATVSPYTSPPVTMIKFKLFNKYTGQVDMS